MPCIMHMLHVAFNNVNGGYACVCVFLRAKKVGLLESY